MSIKLEQLQKAVEDARAAWIGAYGAAEDSAYYAYLKAMQKLKAYKKEHGL